jgi:hypothetical protein
MRRLNFSKIKKAFVSVINYFAKFSKKRYAESKIVTEENKAPSGNYRLRKGGYRHYTHMLVPIKGKFAIIYRSFNKCKLPGAMYIDGKKIYRIERNPHYLLT